MSDLHVSDVASRDRDPPSSSAREFTTTESRDQASMSIQFADDPYTAAQRTTMSNSSNPKASNEVTPIRPAGQSTSRNYNTAGQSSAAQPSTSANRAAAVAATPNDGEGAEVSSKPGLIKKIADKYGSVYLENKASVARDHLALERTFLAWLRTSLAFASIGIAITQLFRLSTGSSRASRGVDMTQFSTGASLPLSPYLGHSVPAELAPILQKLITADEVASTRVAQPVLGPTLLDQLFLLTPDGTPSTLSTRGDVWTDQHRADPTSKLRALGKPIGATFIAISIAVLLIGFHRYFEAQHWIIRGKFPASRGSIAFIVFIAAALILSTLVVVIVVEPSQ